MSKASEFLKMLIEEDDNKGGMLTASRRRAEKEFSRLFGRDRETKPKQNQPPPQQPPKELLNAIDKFIADVEKHLRDPAPMGKGMRHV